MAVTSCPSSADRLSDHQGAADGDTRAGRLSRRARPILATVVLTLTALAAGPGVAETSTDFGRMQHTTRTCERNLAKGTPAPCSALRFEQNKEGLLNIRFVGPGSGDAASNQLTFVGVVKEGSSGLRCRQGRCQLEGPLSTEITSVSELSFDPRGLPTSLPSAWPADGSCRVERQAVRCEARALSGERWSATAGL